ncbi:MetR protein [Histoplasma capsulatum var. duboisii H88]|uniref:MetR protein n=1 Tax=Ajellomyces capsulatus (strain H88) TaxID=544711 RepID=A0A8A1LBX0_AJEC8|nr:MetR protein [Histoplasma capsulatum var. duboisii H88]
MSGYSGRRAPNFSQYLNDLNTIPSPYDQALQEQEQQQTLFDVDAELALFTNAEFLDFDPVGELPVEIPVKYETAEGSEGTDMRNSPDTTTPISAGGDNVKYIDMLNDFNVQNYSSGYPSSMLPIQAPVYPPPQTQGPSPNVTPLTPSDVKRLITPQAIPGPSPSSAISSPTTTAPAPASQGTKRKQDAVVPGTQSIDEAARLAQEEDKRRRNTAASARFRIKKKEREKNMERTVKDVTAKNATLEARITQLEMENRWLKNLITEKNGGALADGDIAGMLDKYRTSAEAA